MVFPDISAGSKSDILIRPVNMRYDVQPLMRLLRLVFHPTLDADGRRVLDLMATTPPILMQINQLAGRFLPGFVCEMDGKIVGNVSLVETRYPASSIIANVAVHPDYRGLGLGRAVMDKALDYLSQRSVRNVRLQVHGDNAVAINLYRRFGFQPRGSVTEWRCPPGGWTPPLLHKPFSTQPLMRNDAVNAYRFDLNTFTADLNWPNPLAHDAYKTSLFRTIKRSLNGHMAESWLIKNEQQHIIGLTSISRRFGQPYRVRLRATGDSKESLTRALLSRALGRLSILQPRQVMIEHQTDDSVTDKLLRTAGFTSRKPLAIMRLDF